MKKIILKTVIVIILIIMIWFMIPYSPLKTKFKKDINDLKKKNEIYSENEIFTKKDFENMPAIIQKYIENNGYLGKRKMNYLKMEYHNVDFMQSKKGPKLKLDYTQYNFVGNPSRMALLESSMFMIPFQGYDYYSNGKGGMKGVIAKLITLFNQTGSEMDKACLVTFLAESLFVPSTLLQNYITFEEINDYQVLAKIEYANQTASGIFTFNDKYEMISFTTNDRAVVDTNGNIEYIPWSALCNDYKINEEGINQPTKFKAVWNYSDGDFIYFDGNIYNILYE